MVRRILVFVAFSFGLFTSVEANAQSFTAGTAVAQVGVQTGGNYGLHYYTSATAGKSFAIDLGLPTIFDDGTVGLGFYYANKSFNQTKQYAFNNSYYFDRTWDYDVYGARFTYHYDFFGVKAMDTYFGLMASYNHVEFSYMDTYYDANPDAPGNPYPLHFNNTVRSSAFAGIRYEFIEHVAAFAEVGLGNYNLFGGVCYRY
ncbi:MAG: hypothetical protein WCL14_10570 [Bacteroidota bacterium]